MIDHQRRRHCAKINQMVPVTVVPRQPRRFECQNRAHIAGTHRRQKATESWALNRSSAGTAQVIIYHNDALKSQIMCTFLKIVLPTLALQVITHLGAMGESEGGEEDS